MESNGVTVVQTLANRLGEGSTKDSSQSSSNTLPSGKLAQRLDSNLMLDGCLPERLVSFVVADNKQPRWSMVFEKVKALAGTGFMAAFVGKCGTGKSQMAVSLAKFVMSEKRAALMVEAMELCDSVKDSFGGNASESARQVLYRFMRPSLLVIDEVNRGLSPYDTRLIQRVLSRRYDKMFDTLLISNETPIEFCELVGDRVVSRINETGGVHEFNWPSFRKTA